MYKVDLQKLGQVKWSSSLPWSHILEMHTSVLQLMSVHVLTRVACEHKLLFYF
jgi:hypothetical protein